MTSKKSIIVYIVHPLADAVRASLIGELSAQPVQPTSLTLDLPDQFQLSSEDTLGKSVEDIIALHKRWMEEHSIDPHAINRLLFIVADEGMSPDSHPHTVLIVKGVGLGENAKGERYQAVRVIASNAGKIITLIERGQHGWEDFWKVAQANGGHFPGE